jgi:hypothetical protein
MCTQFRWQTSEGQLRVLDALVAACLSSQQSRLDTACFRFAEDMKGIQAECSTFFAIMKEDYPELSAELEKRGALDVMPAIVVKWLINSYVDTVPEETVLRIWDALIYEDWKVLYRVGFAILLMAYRSGELMTHDAATILEFLSNIGWALYDVNAVFEVAFEEIDVKGKVRRARINRLRLANRT